MNTSAIVSILRKLTQNLKNGHFILTDWRLTFGHTGEVPDGRLQITIDVYDASSDEMPKQGTLPIEEGP